MPTKLAGTKYTLSDDFSVNRSVVSVASSVSVRAFSSLVVGEDWAAAIQAAINAVQNAGGGTVSIPKGSYRVNSTVTVTNSDVTIQGEEGTVIVNGTTNGPAIQFGDGVTIRYRGGARNLRFAQASGVTPTSGNCGLRFHKWGKAHIRDIEAYPYPAALRQGLLFHTLSQSEMVNVSAENCTQEGIRFDLCLDVYITHLRADANGTFGVRFLDHAGLYCANSTAYGNLTTGWQIAKNTLAQSNDLLFVNCVGDTSGIYNWQISDAKRVFLTQCWGATQLDPALNTYATGFVVGGISKTVQFNGCIAVYNNSDGLSILDGDDIQIIGGFYGTSDNPNGRSSVGSGIAVAAAASDVRIVGASCQSNAYYGISLGAATRVRVSDCDLRLNSLGAVENIGNGQFTNCEGVNPRGTGVTTPAVPASTVTATNTFGVNCMVYVTGGTVTAVSVGETQVFASSNVVVFVPAGVTVAVTYSVAPTWVWLGL
jgi:hypothetical protein